MNPVQPLSCIGLILHTRNTSTGDPRGVELRLTNPHEYYVNSSILMNQRRGLLNEANASLILTDFSVLH